MRDESIVERTVRAANHVREALLSGYTKHRDLGTEAMENFDANLRDCKNRGLIPGPRLFVATHAVASTSGYEIRSENRQNGHGLPRSSDAADGPWDARGAVRRRVGDDIINNNNYNPKDLKDFKLLVNTIILILPLNKRYVRIDLAGCRDCQAFEIP